MPFCVVPVCAAVQLCSTNSPDTKLVLALVRAARVKEAPPRRRDRVNTAECPYVRRRLTAGIPRGSRVGVDQHPPKIQVVTSRSAPAGLAAAQKRIAELEAQQAAHERGERIQAALYRIAETAAAAEDMPSFYAAIHEIVGSLMYADNFYIALYDDERQLINFPYFLDEAEKDIPDPNVWSPFGKGDARGATAYLLRHGEP